MDLSRKNDLAIRVCLLLADVHSKLAPIIKTFIITLGETEMVEMT
jgi:hypothetical protein